MSVRSASVGRLAPSLFALLGLLLLLGLLTSPSPAASQAGERLPPAPDSIWQEIEAAYQAGDRAALAELIARLPATERMPAYRLWETLSPEAERAQDPAPAEPISLEQERAAAAAGDATRARRASLEAESRALVAAAGEREPATGQQAPTAPAATYTVGSNSGSCDYVSVETAIASAASGSTLNVEGKTWTSVNANITDKSLVINGGYNSDCSGAGSGTTILNGNGTVNSVLEIQGSGGTQTVIISSLTIEAGEDDSDDGGGIQVDDGHHLVLNNVLVKNNSSDNGGGVLLRGGATLALTNGTTFYANDATANGGAIYCVDGGITIGDNSRVGDYLIGGPPDYQITPLPNSAGNGGGIYLDNCSLTLNGDDGNSATIMHNRADNGGGVYATNGSSVSMSGPLAGVTDNEATVAAGGGLYLAGGSTLALADGFIKDNVAQGNGGGLYASGSGTTATLLRTAGCSSPPCARLQANSAAGSNDYGGGAYLANGASLAATGATIHGNSAHLGSAVYARDEGTLLTLESSLVYENSATNYYLIRLLNDGDPTGARATLLNATVADNDNGLSASIFGVDDLTRLDVDASIVWGNGNSSSLAFGTGDATFDCSLLQHGAGGSNNLVADPLFRDPAGDDYHLQPASPAVDHCSSGSSTDIDGEARPRDVFDVSALAPPGGEGASPAAEMHTIRIYAQALEGRRLSSVLGRAQQAIDYGAWAWLEVDAAGLAELDAAGVAYTQIEDGGLISFGEYRFDPLRQGAPAAPRALPGLARTPQTPAGRALSLLQLEHPPTRVEQAALAREAQLLQYYPHNTYLVWADAAGRAALERAAHTRWLGGFRADFRAGQGVRRLLAAPGRQGGSLLLQALLVDDGNLDAGVAAVERWGGRIIADNPRHLLGDSVQGRLWQLTLPPERLPDLLQLPQLIHADRLSPLQFDDESSNQILADNAPGGVPQTGYATWLNQSGYDGSGVTVAVVDSGIDWDHPDLNVVSGTEYGGYAEAGEPGSDSDEPGSGHGTHVAGIVAGSGASGVTDGDGFLYGQGVAPGAGLHAIDGLGYAQYELLNGGDDGGFSVGGSALWAYGVPSGGSSNSWATNLAGDYGNNEAATLTSPAIDLSRGGYRNLTLYFARWFALADNGDCFKVQFSNDGGGSWDDTTYQNCGTLSGIWDWNSLQIGPAYWVSNFRYRFLFTSDGSGTELGVYLDDFIIYANQGMGTMVEDAARNADLSNNSWHSGSSPLPMGYTLNAANQDAAVLDAIPSNGSRDPFLTIFSAGNAADDPGDHTTCNSAPCLQSLTDPHEAKNIVVVGNTWSERSGYGTIEGISLSSSRGPAADGRVRPDVMAPGTTIVSTENQVANSDRCSDGSSWGTLHSACSGTSMAAPHVSGAAALFTHFWQVRSGGQNPPPALVKAALINSTGDMAGADDGQNNGTTIGSRPNGHQGWGRLNLDRMLNSTVTVEYYADPTLFTNSGQMWEQQVEVADPAAPLRITLAWQDAAGAPEANPALVNNLDLMVEGPTLSWTGNAFINGWSLSDPNFHDTLNNVENVWIQVPAAGTYTIRVVATQIAGDAWTGNGDGTDQSFSLVCSNCQAVNGGAYDAGADEMYTIAGRNGAACEYNTIGQAIAAAVNGDTIYIPAGTYDERLGQIAKELTFVQSSNDCTTRLAGAPAADLKIDANAAPASYGGVADIDSSSTVTFTDMTLIEGKATWGGVVYVDGGSHLHLDNARLLGGEATNYGGGLRLYGGTAEVTNGSQIHGNEVTGSSGGGGGAAIANGGSLALGGSGVEIYNNDAVDGGGIYLDTGGAISLGQSAIRDNDASGSGGGIYNAGSFLSLVAATGPTEVLSNTATTSGGGIYDSSGTTLSLTAGAGYPVRVAGNTAGDNGGGLYLTSGTNFDFYGDVQIRGNTAGNDGGGLWKNGGSGTLLSAGGARPLLAENEATTGHGGGAYLAWVTSGNEVDFEGADVHDNRAPSGFGGGLYADHSTLNLDNSTVEGNLAGDDGGGLYATNSTISVYTTNPAPAAPAGAGPALAPTCDPLPGTANTFCSEFRQNDAGTATTGYGGAVYLTGATILTVEDTAFRENSGDYGGAIYSANAGDHLDVANSLFSDNSGNYVLRLLNGATLALDSSTLAGNPATALGINNSGATVTVNNSIIAANNDGVISNAAIGGSCNLSQDGGLPGIQEDAFFVSDTTYRLNAGSPALDVCASGPGADLYNSSRPQDADLDGGNDYDMGAHEYVCLSGTPATTLTLAPSGGDILLSWTRIAPNDLYEIHRNSDPYLGRSPANLVHRAPTSQDSWTDGGALGSDPVYYWLVAANCDSSRGVAAEHQGIFRFSLVPGTP